MDPQEAELFESKSPWPLCELIDYRMTPILLNHIYEICILKFLNTIIYKHLLKFCKYIMHAYI